MKVPHRTELVSQKDCQLLSKREEIGGAGEFCEIASVSRVCMLSQFGLCFPHATGDVVAY